MRRITVNATERAVVSKRGVVTGVLAEGRHWIWPGYEVSTYKLADPIWISADNILQLSAPVWSKHMDECQVQEYEIGIEMRDGLFTRVLTPGRYAYWKSPIDREVLTFDTRKVEIGSELPEYLVSKQGLPQYVKVYPVPNGFKGVLYINGEFVRILEPGNHYFWKTNIPVEVEMVDSRRLAIEVAGQEILTKDKAGLRVNFSARYRIADIVRAVVETHRYQEQLYTAIQLALREYIGSMTLDQLLANKQKVGPNVLDSLAEFCESIGVELDSAGIKDIVLPGDMRDIMNQVLVAQKKAQANSIMRQEETASTRSLLNTAKLMEDNAMLLKLKELEYMEQIADKIGEITVNGGSGILEQLEKLVIAKQ